MRLSIFSAASLMSNGQFNRPNLSLETVSLFSARTFHELIVQGFKPSLKPIEVFFYGAFHQQNLTQRWMFSLELFPPFLELVYCRVEILQVFLILVSQVLGTFQVVGLVEGTVVPVCACAIQCAAALR